MKGWLACPHLPDFRQTLEYVKVVIWCNSLLRRVELEDRARVFKKKILIVEATPVVAPVLSRHKSLPLPKSIIRFNRQM